MTQLPHELQTFLTILATDLRIASDRIPKDQVRDPYTGEVILERHAFKDRLKNHALQCEAYSDTIMRAAVPERKTETPGDFL